MDYSISEAYPNPFNPVTSFSYSIPEDGMVQVLVYDLNGRLACRFGDKEEGQGAGQFIAPHGIAVDSHGDIYVSEVSYTIRGSHMNPPRELRSLSKYERQW